MEHEQPNGASVTVQTVLPPWLDEWLTERAHRDGVGKSTFIRMLLIQARRAEAVQA